MTPSLTLLGLLAERENRASAVAPLPVSAGAENVRYRLVEEAEEWWWTLRRVYPARDVIEHYERHAAGLGWSPCAPPRDWESWFESDLGRTQFMLARMWEIEARREAVLLFLRYLEPGAHGENPPRSETLYVNVMVVPVTHPLTRLPQLT